MDDKIEVSFSAESLTKVQKVFRSRWLFLSQLVWPVILLYMFVIAPYLNDPSSLRKVTVVSNLKLEDKSANYAPEEKQFWFTRNNPKNTIVLLPIVGAIDERMEVLVTKQLDAIGRDPDVKAIVLMIDSPGGTVTDSDIIYKRIQDLKIARNIKVVAWFRGVAASGGYYLACTADYIVSSPTAITGSIGVIMRTYNIEKMADKIGIKEVVIKTGPHKDFGSMFREMSEEEKIMLQSILDDFYQSFISIVATARSMSYEEVKRVADGSVFTASQAHDRSLVDMIGYERDAFLKTLELCNIKEAQVIEYVRPPGGLGELFGLKTAVIDFFQDINPQEKPSKGPQFLYLWKPGLE